MSFKSHLPSGQPLPEDLQIRFRTLADMMHTMGCSAEHGEPLDYDANEIAQAFVWEVGIRMGAVAKAKVSSALDKFAKIGATPHEKARRPMCRCGHGPASEDPLFAESGLNADLWTLLK